MPIRNIDPNPTDGLYTFDPERQWWTKIADGPPITISGRTPGFLPILGGPVTLAAHEPVTLRTVGDPPVAWWCPEGHDPGNED